MEEIKVDAFYSIWFKFLLTNSIQEGEGRITFNIEVLAHPSLDGMLLFFSYYYTWWLWSIPCAVINRFSYKIEFRDGCWSYLYDTHARVAPEKVLYQIDSDSVPVMSSGWRTMFGATLAVPYDYGKHSASHSLSKAYTRTEYYVVNDDHSHQSKLKLFLNQLFTNDRNNIQYRRTDE